MIYTDNIRLIIPLYYSYVRDYRGPAVNFPILNNRFLLYSSIIIMLVEEIEKELYVHIVM